MYISSGDPAAPALQRAVYTNIFLVMTGLGVVGPTLPLIQQSFDATYAQVSWTVSVFAAARVVADLFAAALGRRFDPVGLLVIATMALAIGAVVAATAPSLAVLLVGRAVMGLGSGICTTIGLTFSLRLAVDGRTGRASGRYSSALVAGTFVGPGFGAALASFSGWRGALIGTAVAAVASAAWLWWVRRRAANSNNPTADDTAVSEANTSPEPTENDRRLLRWLLGTSVVANVLGAAFFFYRGAVHQILLPFAAHDAVGLTTAALGAVYMASGAVTGALSSVVGTLADRVGKIRVLIVSMLALAVGTAGMGMSHSTAPFVVFVMVSAVANAASGVPPSMLSDHIEDDKHDRAIALHRLGGDVFFAIGPVLAAWMAERMGFTVASYWLGALALLLAMLAMLPRLLLRPR